jgi:eukaryotic-like serine/threonine-protein kinase
MGVVYRARDERLQRDVAVKILSHSSLVDEERRKNFKQEAQLLARLNHPNIATIYDFDSDGDIDFLVMELLSGQTLSDKLRSGPLEQSLLTEYALNMCAGLAAAHAQGILHRDLKPGNLALTSDGRLKVLDFGLAKLLQSQPDDITRSMTMAGAVKGTLAYMAPEQLRGEDVDARADIYAAGAVMYEMATGKPAHCGEQPALLINAVLNERPLPPLRVQPTIKPALEAVILKALEKQPENRYQSVQDLISDLKQLGSAGKPVAVQQLLQARRRRLGFIAIAAAVLVFALAGWLVVRRHSPEFAAARRPVLLVGEFENRTGNSVFDNSLHEMFTASLEQSRVVQVYPASRVADALPRMGRTAGTPIDENTGLEICQRENLQGLLLGSIVKMGSKYVLMARIEAPSGAHIVTAEKFAEREDDIPARVDEIAEALRRKLGESLQSLRESSVPLAQVSSSSLQAVRYFTLGKEKLYHGADTEAAAMFSKALELDPNFAVAHEYLGYAYQHHSDYDNGDEQIRQAALLAGRVSEPERLRIMADYYSTLFDFDKECENYQLLTQIQPQDPSPYINLGYCEKERLNYAAAVKHTEKALEFVPRSAVSVNLATNLILDGDAGRALQVALSFNKDFSADVAAQTQLGRAYMALDRMDDAAKVFEDMIHRGGESQVKGLLCLADLKMAIGRYGEAENALRTAILAAERAKNGTAAAKARNALAEIMLGRGSSAQARRILDEVRLPPKSPSIEFVVAKSYAWSDALAPARKTAHDLDRLTQQHDVPALQALRYLLAAETALAKRDFPEAVKAAQKAVQYQPSTFAVETLARCYAAAGENALATQQYEIVVRSVGELMDDTRTESFEAPAFRRAADAHYSLGVLYEKLGRKDDARFHLQKFLGYWSHHDEDLPRYREAQRVLRNLPSSGVPTPAT